MASARTSFKLLCICTIVLALLVADVSVAAADVNERQPAVVSAESTNKYHLRGNVEAATVAAEEEFVRRELGGDYGSNPAKPNCSSKGTCNK